MSEAQQNKTDTERVSFTVLNARAISSKSIFALVDIEMQIAGVSFSILGLQARRSPSGALTVFLPTYRLTDLPRYRRPLAAGNIPAE